MDVAASEARLRTAAAEVRDRARDFHNQQTTPDQETGDRWDLGQALSHIAEFLPYWVEELEGVVAAGGAGHPFGRTKTTPSRLARIEAGRSRPYEELMREMDAGIDRTVGFMADRTEDDWALDGTHPTRGTMTVSAAIEEFLVSHLEQHAEQLRARG